MLFLEIVIVALQSIRANLFRAALTMLGIIIGVGAVITMLAAGAGAQKRIDEQIASLGANILTVNTSNFFAGGVSRDSQSLVIDDANALRTDSTYLDAVVPEMQSRGQYKLDNVNTIARLSGRRTSIRPSSTTSSRLAGSSTPRTTPTASASSCSAPTFRSGSRRSLKTWSAR